MADLTALLGDSFKQSNVSEDLIGGVNAGIKLATAKETIDSTKMKVAEQKMDLDTKKATAISNRATAIAFAPNKAARERQIRALEVYGGSIQQPIDIDGLRTILDDDVSRLNFQKFMTTSMKGKISSDPAAALSAYSQFGPDAQMRFAGEQAANAQIENKNDQQTKIEQMGNDSAERVAAMKTRDLQSSDDKILKREQVQVRKENRAEAKQLTADLFSVDKIITEMEDVKKSLTDFGKGGTGTGPIATLGGTTSFVSQKTEAMKAKFSKVSMDNMVQMFSGMSKAIDTRSERAAFEATQPSLVQDDKTNFQIIEDRLKSLASLRAKILAGQARLEPPKELTQEDYDNMPAEEDASSSPTPASDFETKAAASGYSQEEINAYLNSKKKAGK